MLRSGIAVMFVLVLSCGVFAMENMPEPTLEAGTSLEAACVVGGAAGSCFTPFFGIVGDSVGYKGKGPLSVHQDCCIAGDTYKVTLKNTATGAKVSDGWTSVGTLDNTCKFAPYLQQRTLVHPAGAMKAKMKGVALPGGVPAGAYLGLQGSWTQTKGIDSCGF